jgi:hypothetical protein
VADNSGLAPDADPICALPEVALSIPCTAAFTATRSRDQLFMQPWVATSLAAAPACDVSHYQGGVAAVDATGGFASGTFYSRGTGEATVPVAVERYMESDEVLAVTVTTPLTGLNCTLLFSALATVIAQLLAP